MKRCVLIVMIFTLWSPETQAQINLHLNSSNYFTYDIMFHNPAGITYPERIQGSVGTQLLWAGLPGVNLRSTFGSYVHPLGDNTAVGLKGVYFNSDLFNQGNLSFLVGQKIFNNKLSVGLNANLLYYYYNANKFQLVDAGDPILAQGNSKNAFSVGFGFIFQPLWWLSLGGSIDHINMPDVSVDNSGAKKRRIVKFGACMTSFALMPQVDVKIVGNDVTFQSGIRQGFLDQKINFFIGYDFVGSDKKELFLETCVNLGSFGLSYNYQYPLTEINQVSGGSHRFTLLYSRGGFPKIYSRPTIFLVNPKYSRVKLPSIQLAGNIGCEDGISSIVIMRNGDHVKDLIYEDKPEFVDLTMDIPLVEGGNEIKIIAHSDKMSRSQKVFVDYAPLIFPPVIKIVSTQDVTTDTSLYALEAKVKDERGLEKVVVLSNNREVQKYEFPTPEKEVNIETGIPLIEGKNIIQIVARNAKKDTSQHFEIVYKPPVPPQITLISPIAAESDTEIVQVRAKIEDERGLVSASVFVNNEEIKRYTYPKRDRQVEIILDVPLIEGGNTIQIKAENDRRKNAVSTFVEYRKKIPMEPPAIAITLPKERITAYSVIRLECEVKNVDSLDGVLIKVNGNRLETRSILVQERTEKGIIIRKDIDLIHGSNRIEVHAFNLAGQASEELEIFYDPILGKPLYNKNWAFIIGISNYEDPNINNLPKAAPDSRQIEDMLNNYFKFDRVVTLYNHEATKDKIISFLEDRFEKTSIGDGIFFFFGGHGETKDTDYGPLGYILPYDAVKDASSTWISMDDIKRSARIAKAKHVFYVMDCCYSGLLLTRKGAASESFLTNPDFTILMEKAHKKTRDVLTAGGRGEEDIDGIFVPRFIRGLLGEADYDHNSYITSWEISLYISQTIPKDAILRGWKQNPQFGKLTHEEGEFIFVRRF